MASQGEGTPVAPHPHFIVETKPHCMYRRHMRNFQIAVPIVFTEWLPHVSAATRGSSQRTLQAACHDLL
jgi:hypothetical protein